MSSYQEGLDAFDRGDYETALKELLPLAEPGDAADQFYLGAIYDKAQDYQEAVRWYRLAAEQGNTLALVMFRRWFQKAIPWPLHTR